MEQGTLHHGRWAASPIRLLLKLVVVFTGCVNIAHTATAYGKNGYLDASVCVRVIVQDWSVINEQVTAVNVRNGQVSRDDRPTIPPNAWFSPDRKMTFFLQTISKTEIGLYIQSTSNGQSILLSTIMLDDLYSLLNTPHAPPWAWSPDSSHFAYVSKLQGKFWLTLTDTTGILRRTQPLLWPEGVDVHFWFYGWSADSAYIATAAAELDIWSGKDLSHVGTGIPMAAWFSRTRFMAWSPHGHRLAALLGNEPTKLSVWSPEHGVEAAAPVLLDNNHFYLYWSPDEHALQLVSSTGHVSYDEIFTLNGNVLLRVAIADAWPDLIGWTEDGNAVINIWYSEPRQLLMVDTRNRRITVAATGNDSWVGDTSPDGRFMLITTRQGQAYRVEFARIDGTGRTPFIDDTLTDEGSPPDPILYPVTWSPNSRYVAKAWYSADRTGYQTFVGQPDSSGRQGVDGLVVGWTEENWLIYVDNQSQHLRVLKPETRTQFSLDKATQDDVWISVSPDKRTLLERSQTRNLLFVSLSETDPWTRSVDLGGDVTFHDILPKNQDLHVFQIPQSLAWSPDSTMVAVVYSDILETDGVLKVFSREGEMLLQAPFSLDPVLRYFDQLSVIWTTCG